MVVRRAKDAIAVPKSACLEHLLLVLLACGESKLNPAELKRQISKLQNKLIELSSAKAKK
jgi:hypothetical protein